MRTKGFIDKILTAVISRKLTVFVIATLLMSKDLIESGDWVDIAMLYIGTQGAIDLFNTIRNGARR